MAKQSDSQLKLQELYGKKMEKWKEAYKVRTDFVSKFVVDNKKTKLNTSDYIVNFLTGSTSGASTGSAEAKSDTDTASSGGVGVVGGSDKAKKVVAEGSKWIGKVKYVFGARRPDQGRSDCSGFTQYVFNKAIGMNIGPTTLTQVTKGVKIDRSKIVTGDMIFFQGTYRAGVSHVGIVLDNQRFMHCGSSKGVCIANIDDSYFKKHFLMFRRVIEENNAHSTTQNVSGKANSGSGEGEGGDPNAKAFMAFTASTVKAMEEEAETIPYELSDAYGVDPETIPVTGIVTDPGAPIYDGPSFDALYGTSKYDSIELDIGAQYIKIPTSNRAIFIERRIMWARNSGYKHFESLNKNQFVHIDRHDGYEGNLYSPDAKIAFEIFRLKSKREKLEILSGFRFSPQGLLSPHEAGCAIDIRVKGFEDARYLADVAWACGFRAIAVGGDIEGGTGFLHLDIGPKSEWGYDDIPIYRGPGRWVTR